MIISGISHGEDVLLIYWHTLRDFAYSEEEANVGRNLINLYFNFANDSLAVYGDETIEQAQPDDLNCLEIFSPTDVKHVKLDASFGNFWFWVDIEEMLLAKEKARDEL